jgi:predicted ester cyclase
MRVMAEQSVETLVERFWGQVIGRWDEAAARELVTEDFAWRGSLGAESTGLHGLLQYAAAARLALPDLSVTLDESAVAGHQLWARLSFRGTHSGLLLGVPATGRQVTYVGMGVHDVRDDRLSRVWVVADTLDVRRQVTD